MRTVSFQIGGHGERAHDAIVRDGIIVAVEAHIGRLAGRDGTNLVGRKAVAGQRQQTFLLLDEGVAHRQGLVFRAAALARRAAGPGIGLGVEVGQTGEVAAGEEGVADIADRSLYSALSDFPEPPQPAADRSDNGPPAPAGSD